MPELPAMPLLFEPLLKERVWGGDALRGLNKPVVPGATIGESWELADLPREIAGGVSRVTNGPAAGASLRDLLREHRRAILGSASPSDDDRFPVLLKLLDAREALSLQVHPDEHYVMNHPQACLKHEACYVVSAKTGAVFYAGLRPGVTAMDVRRHAADGSLENDLIVHEVAAGDVITMPAGTCHALGAGVVVAEAQTPSDTTFRLFDWNRGTRELHIEQALECLRFEPECQPTVLRRAERTKLADGEDAFSAGSPQTVQTAQLTRSAAFALSEIAASAGASHEIVTAGQPIMWMVLRGSIMLAWTGKRGSSGNGEAICVRTGATVLFPATLAHVRAVFAEPTVVLEITLPV